MVETGDSRELRGHEEDDAEESSTNCCQKARWVSSEEALWNEGAAEAERRQLCSELGVDVSADTFGVCLSGGGIRSACLCLGMLWRLAEKELFSQISYLSSVSGGSYANAALASEFIGSCREGLPNGIAEVHEQYREAVKATIRRFQRNSNYPFHAISCVAQMRNVYLQRFLGILSLVGLVLWLFVVHPATCILFIALPLAVYMDVVYAGDLRYALCAPPFTCASQECSVQDYLPTSARYFGYNGNGKILIWICLILACMLAIVRILGIVQWLHRRACYLTAHIVNGLDMYVRRLLLVLVGMICILNVVLIIQVQNYGSMDGFQHNQLANSTGPPSGWTLDVDTSIRDFQANVDTKSAADKFETWYTCFNYTATALQKIDGHSRVEDSSNNRVVDLGDFGKCHSQDFPNRASDLAYASFYFGGSEHLDHAQYVPSLYDEDRQSFYQEWFDACRQEGQTMCVSQSSRIAGCCSVDITWKWILWFLAVLIAIGGVIYLITDVTFMLKAVLMCAGPLFGFYCLLSLLTWRIFGPVTASPSSVGKGQTMIGSYFPYSDQSQWRVFGTSLILCLCLLPFFELIQRLSYKYNHSSLTNSFFREDEKKVLFGECVDAPLCPTLIFGSTHLMYQNRFDEVSLPRGKFCMSNHYIGGKQTGYLKTPSHVKLSQAMALSAAALETALLVDNDSWATRFWIIALNLAQGDWVRFDACNVCNITDSPNSSKQRFIDSLPSFLIFMTCYACCLAAELFLFDHQCTNAEVCVLIAGILVAATFAASFFVTVCRCFMMGLQPSPIVRAMHMMCLATPVTDIDPPPYMYIGDGGLLENSGCLELLRRRIRRIIVMEAGDDPKMEMLTLNLLLKYVDEDGECSFFVPGNPLISVREAIEEYQKDDTRTFVHLGILYDRNVDPPLPESERAIGDLFWVQNRPGGPRGWTERPQVRTFPNDLGDDSNSDEVFGDDGRDLRPLSELNSSCWNGCCLPCGEFPTIETANQFFSQAMAANFMHFGYLLTEDAIGALAMTLAGHGGKLH